MVRRLGLVVAFSVLVLACGGGAVPGGSAGPSSLASAADSAAPHVSLKINWTAKSGTSGGLWTAFESGYFKDENLDVELVNIPSSSRAVAALLAHEADFSHLDGQVVIDADIQGAGLKLIYGVNNRLVFSMMTKQDIKTPQDLKGRKVGVTTVGASTHTAAQLALRMWDLQPKDVTFISLNEVPNILTALVAGQIDAGVMSPPTNTRAKAAGFRELLNFAVDGPEWPSVAVGATAAYLSANPTVGERVVRAYARGVHRFKSDRTFAEDILKKYLNIDDQTVIDDTWDQYRVYLVEVPHVLGMQRTLDVVSEGNAKAKSLKVDDLVDDSYVKRLDDAGYFKTLYGK